MPPEKPEGERPAPPPMPPRKKKGGATVSFTAEGSSAEMEFSEDSRSGASATMYIHPQEPGITYFTFLTEEHSVTFTVMVIVL